MHRRSGFTIVALAAILLALAPSGALAQTSFSSQLPGGFSPATVPNFVQGIVPLCLNPSGVAVPCSPSTVTTGQAKIATSSTAVCLASAALVNGAVVKALASNSAAITIGGAGVTATMDGTGNGYVLAPGEAMSFAVPSANLVCINGTAGNGVSYAGN